VVKAFRVSATDASSRPLTPEQAIATPPSLDVRDPVPSPDGRQLAFLADDARGASGGVQVWLMNVDGTGLVQLTRFDPESFPYSCRAPAWTRS
jgi:Tol biopolymer transport system component